MRASTRRIGGATLLCCLLAPGLGALLLGEREQQTVSTGATATTLYFSGFPQRRVEVLAPPPAPGSEESTSTRPTSEQGVGLGAPDPELPEVELLAAGLAELAERIRSGDLRGARERAEALAHGAPLAAVLAELGRLPADDPRLGLLARGVGLRGDRAAAPDLARALGALVRGRGVLYGAPAGNADAVVLALGRLGAVAELGDALGSRALDDDVRYAVAAALVTAGEDGLEATARCLATADSASRAAIVRALGRGAASPEVAEALLLTLPAGDGLRGEALLSLAQLETGGGRGVLLVALSSPDPEERWAAATGLEAYSAAPAVRAALERAVTLDPAPRVRRAAERSLARRATTDAAGSLGG